MQLNAAKRILAADQDFLSLKRIFSNIFGSSFKVEMNPHNPDETIIYWVKVPVPGVSKTNIAISDDLGQIYTNIDLGNYHFFANGNTVKEIFNKLKQPLQKAINTTERQLNQDKESGHTLDKSALALNKIFKQLASY
jgi:hypothetical protein